MSTFNDGVLTACPNIWFSNMGNLLEQTWKESLSKIGRTGLYQALLSPSPRLIPCKGCFTPWELLSMYFDNEITIEELCISPTYGTEIIKKLIIEQKQEYLNGKIS